MSDLDRRVRFEELPPAVRRRFVACAEGREEPRPLLATTREKKRTAYALLAVGAGASLAALLWLGWGLEPDGEHQTGGAWITAKYAAVAMLFTGATAAALRERARQRALPWPSGRYLFPSAFIDATTAELRVVPLGKLRRARELARGPGRGRLVQLEFEGRKSELLSRDPDDDERLTPTLLKSLKVRLEKAERAGDEAALARLDPLVLGDADAEAVGGYREGVKRVARAIDGPQARPISRWLERPVALALAATLALSAGLGGYVLPALALAQARESHEPDALRRVAVAWPFAWVARAAGVRVESADEVTAELARRLREPRLAAALAPLLRGAEKSGDPRVPSYVEFEPVQSPALSPIRLGAEQGRRIGVAFQRSLGLPPELFEVSTRGTRPYSPEPRHALFHCSVEASPREYPTPGRSYPGFFLVCDVSLFTGAASERVAEVPVEPSSSLDLAKLVAEEDAGSGALSSGRLDDSVYAVLMNSAIDGLTTAFKASMEK